jgi:hypothetical protein
LHTCTRTRAHTHTGSVRLAYAHTNTCAHTHRLRPPHEKIEFEAAAIRTLFRGEVEEVEERLVLLVRGTVLLACARACVRACGRCSAAISRRWRSVSCCWYAVHL